MKLRLLMLLLSGFLARGGSAQSPEIVSFGHDGAIRWLASSGSVCSVKWASSLTATTEWHHSWVGLEGILMTRTSAEVRVPMVYRIVSSTNIATDAQIEATQRCRANVGTGDVPPKWQDVVQKSHALTGAAT